MRMSAATGYEGYRVIDDSTGKEIQQWIWVDDCPPQYALAGSYSVWGLPVLENIVDVTRVSVNHAARQIHVNDPPHVHASSGIVVRELHACEECTQEPTCARINYCAQFRCGFGEARKP